MKLVSIICYPEPHPIFYKYSERLIEFYAKPHPIFYKYSERRKQETKLD